MFDKISQCHNVLFVTAHATMQNYATHIQKKTPYKYLVIFSHPDYDTEQFKYSLIDNKHVIKLKPHPRRKSYKN